MHFAEGFWRPILQTKTKMGAHDGVGVEAARLAPVFGVQEPQFAQPVHGHIPARDILPRRKAMKSIRQTGDGGLGEQRIQSVLFAGRSNRPTMCRIAVSASPPAASPAPRSAQSCPPRCAPRAWQSAPSDRR